ncbi:response regulator transcription factor [Nitrosomonas sp. Nm166]|uniref:LuxR C-terminal-related transcriptional regulator n=1 Tax=Nitrosomonas sp. Nm166 TaxID=1881054 RepID=UPI000AD9CD0B|nr:response regulator transcription factor [Nitrosomonas sp. Nm166]
MILILLASANKEILSRWKQGLSNFSPIYFAHGFESLTEKLVKLKPEILLLDYELSGLKDQQSILRLINLKKDIKIVVLSPGLSEEMEWNLFKVGVKGCCQRDIQPEQIKRVIDVILEGELWIRRTLTNQMLDELVKITHKKKRVEQATHDLLENLTHREYEIAILIGHGDSNKKIAQSLAITERTVKAHLTEIFRKLRISDRIKLALIIKDVTSRYEDE